MKIAKFLLLLSAVLLMSAAAIADNDKNVSVNITKENATSLAIDYAKTNLNASDNVSVIGIELDSNKKMYQVTLRDNSSEYTLYVDSTSGAVSAAGMTPGKSNEEVKPVNTEQKRQEDMSREGEKNMQFTQSGGNYNGKYVSFQYSGGSILKYTLSNTTIFDSISTVGSTLSQIKAEGSVVTLMDKQDGANIELEIHDNPDGLMKFTAENTANVSFTLSTGIRANVNQSAVDLTGVNASIVSVGEEGNVSFTLSANILSASLSHAKIMFKAVPVGARTEQEQELENRVVEGVTQGKIGAVVNIDKNNSHDEVSLDMVNASVTDVRDNTVSVNVSSELPQGKTILLRVNNSILKAASPGDIRVLFDGIEIQQADNYTDVMNPTDKPKYLIVIGAKDVEALVSIPKFSEHQIIITTAGAATATPTTAVSTAPTTAAPTTTPRAPGFTAALGMVSIIAFAVLYRRKNI